MLFIFYLLENVARRVQYFKESTRDILFSVTKREPHLHFAVIEGQSVLQQLHLSFHLLCGHLGLELTLPVCGQQALQVLDRGPLSRHLGAQHIGFTAHVI